MITRRLPKPGDIWKYRDIAEREWTCMIRYVTHSYVDYRGWQRAECIVLPLTPGRRKRGLTEEWTVEWEEPATDWTLLAEVL